MKIHLPLILRSALLSCLAIIGAQAETASAFTTTTDLGGTMYMGDSITHGAQSTNISWRWWMHRLFADNGINYEEKGVIKGAGRTGDTDYDSPLYRDVFYGNTKFENIHSSYSGARVSDISGGTWQSQTIKFANTNIQHWLGQKDMPQGSPIAAVEGKVSTFFMMIGTNDTVNGPNHSSMPGNVSEYIQNLSGEFDTILDAIKKHNSQAQLVITDIPAWYQWGKLSQESINSYTAAITQINKGLHTWAEGKEGVTMVNANAGIVDVANTTTPGRALQCMFTDANGNGLHPNDQGCLLIAGNLAKALGYAGATAGQERRAVNAFNQAVVTSPQSISVSGDFAQSWNTTPEGAFTLSFTLGGIGNGGADNWDTSHSLSVSVGNGTVSGTLDINEAYIQWGSSILYSMDTSQLTAPLRIAYVRGNSKLGLSSGFYVWMDDQLIGEGLATAGSTNGVQITNSTDKEVILENLYMDSTGSYAPESDGKHGEYAFIEAEVIDTSNPYINNPGVERSWSQNLFPESVDVASSQGNVSSQFGNYAGGVASGSGANIFMTTEGAGPLYITLFDITTTSFGGFMGAGSSNNGASNGKVFNGNGYLRFLGDEATSTSTWFGLVNTTTGGLEGDLYMEFSAPNMVVGGQSWVSGPAVSVAGLFQSAYLHGKLTLVFNAGSFNSNIVGGAVREYNNNNPGTVDKVAIYLNGGTFSGNIYAGGVTGSVGATDITITGDEMVFNAGVTMISAGSYYTSGTNGAVTGDATITIADATANGAIGQYTGTLSGGATTVGSRSLVFSNAKLGELKATLADFDRITIEKGSRLSMSSFGGARDISVFRDSELTLLVGATEELSGATISLFTGSRLVVENGVSVELNATGDPAQLGGDIELQSGSALAFGSSSQGSYTIYQTAGSRTDAAAPTGSGFTATIVVDDTLTPAGQYEMALSENAKLNLAHISAGSTITGLNGSDPGDITLTGENNICLKHDANLSADEALLQATGALKQDSTASLRIDINDLVSSMANTSDATLEYYLSKGDLSGLSGVVFDASLLVLGWDAEFTATGKLVFTRHKAATNGENIFVSNNDTNSNGAWTLRDPDSDIYTDAASRDAVVVNSYTHVDLSRQEVTGGFEEPGLILKNLIGTAPEAELSVQGDSERDIRVTISNRLSDSVKEALKTKGIEVENSLTYRGSIRISDAMLQIEHEEADTGKHSTDSRTIVEGGLTISGSNAEGVGLRMKSGVLELRDCESSLGSGAVEFYGTDGQLVVNGGSLSIGGAISAEQQGPAEREHILLQNSGVLVLEDGATVGSGVLIGRQYSGGADFFSSSAGALSVAQGAWGMVSADSLLHNVELNLHSGSILSISAQTVRSFSTDPTDTTPHFIIRGLSGAGMLRTHSIAPDASGNSAADMVIIPTGQDHIFSGNLSAYTGTMYVSANPAAPYAQVFSGVQGGQEWNVVNDGGRIIFNLMGEDGRGSNSLTMGALSLADSSSTTILMDLAAPTSGSSGLHLQTLEIAPDAAITIGHHSGTISLEGEDGDTCLKAIGVIEAQNLTPGGIWSLTGVRNAEMVDVRLVDGVLYLVYSVDNSNKYAPVASSPNSRAGANLLWAAGAAGELTGDLAAVDRAVLDLVVTRHQPGHTARANSLLAAVAGSSNAVLSQATSADMERQLRTMRNRAAALGDTEKLSFWLNAESAYHKQNTAANDPGFKTTGWGGTVGMHTSGAKGYVLGLSITAMYNDIRTDGPDRLKGDLDTQYLTGMLKVNSSEWSHTFIASVGSADANVQRTVNYGAGSYTTHGATDATSVGLMYELGYAIPLTEGGTSLLQPVINISWRYSKPDSYSETGSNAALHVDAKAYNTVTLAAGFRAQSTTESTSWHPALTLELRSLLKTRLGDRRGKADVNFATLSGLPNAQVRSAAESRLGVELGASLSIPLDQDSQIFVDFSAEVSSRATDIDAIIGYRASF